MALCANVSLKLCHTYYFTGDFLFVIEIYLFEEIDTLQLIENSDKIFIELYVCI